MDNITSTHKSQYYSEKIAELDAVLDDCRWFDEVVREMAS